MIVDLSARLPPLASVVLAYHGLSDADVRLMLESAAAFLAARGVKPVKAYWSCETDPECPSVAGATLFAEVHLEVTYDQATDLYVDMLDELLSREVLRTSSVQVRLVGRDK